MIKELMSPNVCFFGPNGAVSGLDAVLAQFKISMAKQKGGIKNIARVEMGRAGDTVTVFSGKKGAEKIHIGERISWTRHDKVQTVWRVSEPDHSWMQDNPLVRGNERFKCENNIGAACHNASLS